MIQENNILTADEGKWLTDGSTYSRQVWLGRNDRPERWRQVEESEVPDDFKAVL